MANFRRSRTFLSVFLLTGFLAACSGGGSSGGDTGQSRGDSSQDGAGSGVVIESNSRSVVGFAISVDGTDNYPSGEFDAYGFRWTLTERPAGSATALLEDATIPINRFIPDRTGTYAVTLAVTDPSGASASATRRFVVTQNLPPKAVIRTTPPSIGDRRAVLDAGHSTDPEGLVSSFHWVLLEKPAGSGASLPATTHSHAVSLLTDRPGTYRYRLVVADGVQQSPPAQGSITVTAAEISRPPTARVSGSKTLEGAVAQTLLVDGGPSSDPDGDPLSYSWSIVEAPAGSTAAIAGGSSRRARFTPDRLGHYVLALSVHDGFLPGSTETVTIAVRHFFHALPFRVTDAEHSAALDRVVMVSSEDTSLHQFGFDDASLTSVELSRAATTVSISPDGLFAAVGHDGWVSLVDLEANEVTDVVPVSTAVSDLVLDGSLVVHAFPGGYVYEPFRSVDPASAVETPSTGSVHGRTAVALHSDGVRIYGADNGISPSDLERYDVATLPGIVVGDSRYHGDYEVCGGLWMEDAGDRIFTRCGHVFHASNDPSEDMTIADRIPGVARIEHLDHSATAGRVALVPRSSGHGDTQADTRVYFFDDESLSPSGALTLPGFAVGDVTHPAHGRFVFLDTDGARYAVIEQADPASALLLDFGILLSAEPGTVPPSTRPVADAGTGPVVTLGSSVTLDGSASHDPGGSPLSYAWTLVSRPAGSKATLAGAATAMPTFVADRLGTYVARLTVADGALASLDRLVVVTAFASASALVLPIAQDVVDAEMSKSLDRLVHVASDPARLYTFDAVTYAQTALDLPLAPTAVSVGPDGLTAAVGHDGWVSHVDLVTNRILATWPVTATAHDVVLDGGGRAHVFSRFGTNQVRTLDLATGIETRGLGYSVRARTIAALHPSGTVLYGTNDQSSRSYLERYDLDDGVLTFLRHDPAFGEHPSGGALWISADGLRIFTETGATFRASSAAEEDMTYAGAIPGVTKIRGLSHSAEAGYVAVIPDAPRWPMMPEPTSNAFVRVHEDQSLTHLGTVPLPAFPGASPVTTSHGRFVFHDDTGTRRVVIMQADDLSEVEQNFAIFIF